MLQFHLVTLFPEFFRSPLETSLMARARQRGLMDVSFHDPREYSTDRHRHVDDRPYGGGPGMVMRPEPLAAALRAVERPGRILFMSPAAPPFTQALARELSAVEHITLVCGRYEGIDARLLDCFPLEPVCVGESVLNGGETAALAVMESVARLLPGFMGKDASGEEESFSRGLLEYPHYTRPERFGGQEVPRILREGNHAAIATWRREASLAATLRLRPELLDTAPLDRQDATSLASLPRKRLGNRLSFCLMHYPVMLDAKNSGVSSLTNLDVHDIARISRSYGMGPLYVVTPLKDQLRLLEALVAHWTDGPGARGNADRKAALDLVRPAASLDEVMAQMTAYAGCAPRLVASSAAWPPQNAPAPLTPHALRRWCEDGPVLLLLGTAHGLAAEALERCDGRVRPLRFLGYNHLSVRSAAAILADRILGDYL